MTAELLLFKLTVSPFLPAGELNATVHASLAAPVMEVLVQDKLWICATETNGHSSNPRTNKVFISVLFLAGQTFDKLPDVHDSVEFDILAFFRGVDAQQLYRHITPVLNSRQSGPPAAWTLNYTIANQRDCQR